jgi:hypothetical protein
MKCKDNFLNISVDLHTALSAPALVPEEQWMTGHRI